jgi:hypothetical protein
VNNARNKMQQGAVGPYPSEFEKADMGYIKQRRAAHLVAGMDIFVG